VYHACRASSDTSAFSSATSAAVSAVADAFLIACDPTRTEPLQPFEVEGPFTGAARAVATAIAKASATCTSSGKAFGCAQAQAQANAWARATAEAYARAYGEAVNKCGTCDPTVVEASSSAEVIASSFVDLVADVYARAEVQVCVNGNDNASAEAYSNCFAKAYALVSTKAVAEALVSGKCTTAKTDVFVQAVTTADYSDIESCAEITSKTPGAVADTSGTSAEAVRSLRCCFRIFSPFLCLKTVHA
jgi:hypothetical protein